MNELLNAVLHAHGGLDNWSKVRSAVAKLSLGGPFWGWKGWPEVYARQTVTFDTRREHISFEPFTQPDRLSVLDTGPERVEIRSAAGELINGRESPRDSFPKYENDVPWDALQLPLVRNATKPQRCRHPTQW